MTSFELSHCTVEHKRRSLGIATAVWAALLLFACSALLLRMALFDTADVAVGWAGLVPTAVTAALVIVMHRYRIVVAGTAAVDGEALLLNGEAIVKRSSIHGAIVTSRDGTSVVRVQHRWPWLDVDVVTPGEAEAHALVSALGFGADQRANVFGVAWGRPLSVAVRVSLLVLPLAVGLLGVCIRAPAIHQGVRTLAIGLVAFFLPALLLSFLRARANLTVGVDGVLVQRRLGRARFVSYPRVSRVDIVSTAFASYLRIDVFDAAPIVCHLWGGLTARDQDASRALLHAIASAIEVGARSRSRSGSPRAGGLLARGTLDAKAWVRALGKLAEDAGGYRAVAVPAETLWAIVIDTAAAPTERAGAAAALRSRLDDEGRARLRIAGAISASPELRFALAAAADEVDEDALGDALTPLRDDARAHGRR